MTSEFMEQITLNGKTALVTGSTQGLGLEIAKGLLNAGANVFIHGRGLERVNQVCRELHGHFKKVDSVVFDLRDEAEMNAGLKKIGKIDILVNNAGIRKRHGLDNLTLDEMDEVVRNNLMTTIALCKKTIPGMKERGWGRIVNVTSIQGSLVRANDFIYPITKKAIETMTKGLAVAYGQYGITCNSIAPGTFETEYNAKLINQKEVVENMQQRNPMKRWGRPEEIVGPALFFCSDMSTYVNGQCLKVDGGFTISF